VIDDSPQRDERKTREIRRERKEQADLRKRKASGRDSIIGSLSICGSQNRRSSALLTISRQIKLLCHRQPWLPKTVWELHHSVVSVLGGRKELAEEKRKNRQAERKRKKTDLKAETRSEERKRNANMVSRKKKDKPNEQRK
jgi:hypothetical protein